MANPYQAWESFPLAEQAPPIPASDTAPKAELVNLPVRRAQPAQTPAVTTGPATLPTGSSNANSASQLGDLRAPIAQEFQANPDARQKLINSVYKEVQDQPQAWLPYIESAMNRGIARNQSLVYTIDPTLPKAQRYFPYDTWPKQAPEAFAKKVNPLIDQALQGSNMAGYATGNESGDVRSKDAPIAFDPGTGERFIVENPDLGWASKLSPIPILSTRSE
jgi:hypothetical protein